MSAKPSQERTVEHPGSLGPRYTLLHPLATGGMAEI